MLPGPRGAEGRTGVTSGPAPPIWEEEGCGRTQAREALPGILWSMGPLWLDSRRSHSGHTCPACSFRIVIWKILAQKKPYPGSRWQWHRHVGTWKGLWEAGGWWGQGRSRFMLGTSPSHLPPPVSRAHTSVKGQTSAQTMLSTSDSFASKYSFLSLPPQPCHGVR